jgi:hypothetical protein
MFYPPEVSRQTEGEMERGKALLAALVLPLLVSGCTTLADAQAARGSGTLRNYGQPIDKVWPATLASAHAAGLTVVSSTRDTGTILGQSTIGFFTWGENVAIYVTAAGQNRTRVEVISKAAVSTNITATNWERRVFEQLDQRIAQMPPP